MDVRAPLCVAGLFLMVLAATSLWSMKAGAQEDGAPGQELEELEVAEPRAGSVDVLGGRVRFPRPTGWRIVQVNDEGVAATFRSASDRDAQIEVRMSTGISSARWDRFMRTFDGEIRESGFQVQEESINKPYGGRRGQLVEYRLELQEQTFRLVIWHTQDGDRAWIFSGFFREARRDAHFQTFEEFLDQVVWNL